MTPLDPITLAPRILCCPDCASALDDRLHCLACGRSCAVGEDGIISALPASMDPHPKDREQIQSVIETAGPGEHGERVVQYEQAFHDEQAAYYDKLFGDPLPLLAYYKRLISHQIYSHVKRRAFVVDLCCGTGKSSLPLIEKGIFVVAIDVSREMLRVYGRKCVEKGYRDVLFVHADASRPPLRENSCPAITMIGGLHHIRDQEGSVHHCHRALEKDGLLIFHEPIQTGHTSRIARFLENLYAFTDPGRVWRAAKRRLGVATPTLKDASTNALCDFTPYERPFHSAQELLALMPPQTSVVTVRSQGVLSFHEFAPPVQRAHLIARPLAAIVVQCDDWLSGDARRKQSGDALFTVCRKTA